MVGQDLAIRQLVDAVCHHLDGGGGSPGGGSPGGDRGGGGGSAARPGGGRPLVVSAHGPPGVGKTLTHQLLARALYSPDPRAAPDCPGHDCRGYAVFYGMDYLEGERAGRLEALRTSLLAHVRRSPDALIVVEEYDKLDCDARAFWRQLLQHPERANVTWDR